MDFFALYHIPVDLSVFFWKYIKEIPFSRFTDVAERESARDVFCAVLPRL
jgi:hypothetical protein